MLEKSLSVTLITAILGAVAALCYVIAVPTIEANFTEFYILGLKEKAAHYPKEVRVGEEVKVIVGIINHEHATMTYTVVVKLNEVKSDEVGPIILEYKEKWETEVSFVPAKAGDNQKVEFLLYNEGGPYFEDPPHLWINVTE
ncbi:DUF1616 domain-containing protein [Chloroflexota bacterium]